jgi:cell division protein ZapA (FtsZ GTPase activity inhibitor)
MSGQDTAKQGEVYEVEIAGTPMRLKSSHDEQTVKELVALVDQKIREALKLTKTGSLQSAAILASLNLAEDLLLLKRRTKTELDHLESRAQKVLSELESSRVTQPGLNN